MSDSCSFPNCSRHPQSNGYCVGHQAFASFKQVKVPKGLNKVADKRKEEDKEYKKIVAQMASTGKKCEIKSPVCTKVMEGLHHMKKRGKHYLDRKFLKRSCNPCNRYLEEHPDWAMENGHSVSKFKKEEPAVVIAENDSEVNAIIIQK